MADSPTDFRMSVFPTATPKADGIRSTARIDFTGGGGCPGSWALEADALTPDERRAWAARVVRAGDEARRCIQRNLHDTTQQRLVSLALQVQGLTTMLEPGQTELAAELDSVACRLGEALEELQEIARGLHPPVLSAGGLAAAVRALAQRSPLPVEVSIGLSERLPASLEANAYYIVSEALTNVAKHADASVARVDVKAQGAELTIRVRDDGIGGADLTGGSGLSAIQDRVHALGGTVSMSSPAGCGTRLAIRLPIT
jgi:signal transduction histidine kinase